MPVTLVLADPELPQPTVGPDAADRLARLGVTDVLLVRDRLGVGVLLEGWAFDPAHIDDAVAALFPAGGERVRTLHEIGRLALSVAGLEGRAR